MSDLWILAGQSNMEGVGNLSGELESSSAKVRSFAHGDKWQTAEEPLHWLAEAVDTVHWGDKTHETIDAERANQRANRNKGAGLGLPFAKAVANATGIDIDLVPTAHGGTSMEQWDPAKKDMGGASLFGAMVRRVKLALETQPDATLKGVLWYQGESDCNPDAIPLYYDRMLTLIDAFRTELSAPELPFYIVQLGSFAVPDNASDPGRGYWSEIRELQRKLETQPNVAVIPAIDLDLDDPIHIGTPGLKRLGKRMANVAIARVYGKPAPTPISLESATREGGIVRVKFAGVNGKLIAPDTGGRVFGFSINRGGQPEPAVIYKAVVEGNDTVVLSINDWDPLDADVKLWYGYGYSPVCQLVDNADMAVPTFGPIAI